VEQAHHPHLRGKPIIVCGDPSRRGVVTAASYDASASLTAAKSIVRALAAAINACASACFLARLACALVTAVCSTVSAVLATGSFTDAYDAIAACATDPGA
jgi:nucleotidyltransferase/DNA polymerase involved in DNA repair